MNISVKFIYNATINSPIEKGFEIMYFDDYSYEDLEDGTLEERVLIDLIIKELKRQYGYYSIKVTGISEL
ncbi:hypothetical protein FH508_0004180 [Lysinibacillus sp. CD3-6]|uniref:hypothetical protein n=1 Tax=Lysinibacillus TaxID=400634 RepID=UPI00116C274F|nr:MULTISPECIES: hypothetical protein [Lysinibacillus]QSB10429.1 hypothetical protein JTI58_01550 [Lysinibacillus fusiformis]UED81095.1 hypothetical protein FH508_0004180 [Lysinibacillus sp. CD3-6]